ncbi:MAG: response regulator transcription factor, partial [Lachnospiraceae bacterium]|nr:response regulator transcription factor [Lachnospiraceae bacterium]
MLIYIVEDDKNIREIESYALKNTGYEVRAFEQTDDFNRALTERLPELIILDIMLPDADGLDVLTQIRSMPTLQDVPVIMVTAKGTELDKVIGLDRGADDYIAKPFGVMELISRVKALLRRSRPAAGSASIVQVGPVCLDEEKHEVTVEGVVCDLTYKEYELLKLLMSKVGVVITRESIM